MGSNPTQAFGILLFFVAVTLIAAGMAMSGNILFLVVGIVVLAASLMMFLKAKPWEHQEGDSK